MAAWPRPTSPPNDGGGVEEASAEPPPQLVPGRDPLARLSQKALRHNAEPLRVLVHLSEPALDRGARDLGVELDSPCCLAGAERLQAGPALGKGDGPGG